MEPSLATPPRRLTGHSASSSTDGGSSAFWSDGSIATAFSPATTSNSAFSSSPSSSSSSRSFPYCASGRGRASTGISFSLDVLQEAHTCMQEEQSEASQIQALFQGFESIDSDIIAIAPTLHAGEEVVDGTGFVDTVNIRSTDEEGKLDHPRLSRLFTTSKERARSLTRQSFTGRSRLEKQNITERQSDTWHIPAQIKRLQKLQGRYVHSAPTSPALSPCPSTEKLKFFRSRPPSVAVSGVIVHEVITPSITPYHTYTPFVTSPVSSCNASFYTPALDSFMPNIAIHNSLGIVEPLNRFDSLLPREVRIRIFSMLVQNSIYEHKKLVQTKEWTAKRSGDSKWVGEAGGMRELVKLSGVSREWRDLAFDGQLWHSTDICRVLGNDAIAPSGLVRLAECAGSFLRRLDLRGFASLEGQDLDSLTAACSAYAGTTSLNYVDLTGCRAISTQSLHHLLAHSPAVETLKLRALPAVISSTCDVIISSAICHLTILDVSLCRNLHASALLYISQPGLRKLFASRLPGMDTRTAAAIPSTFPFLETLDVGYSRILMDEAFLSWPVGEGQTFNLRHLRLSGCTRITDQACWNLVGKIPYLEIIELASIGANLRDAGVVKLIEASPKLRKVDLEDAISLTDRTITALTPRQNTRYSQSLTPLEHVNFTNMPEISEAALVRLVRACPMLRVVECSNSFHVSDIFVKTFTHHIRKNAVIGAELSIVDCRSVGRQTFREVHGMYRPRRGIRDYASRQFEYLDAEASPDGRRGITECDEKQIVLHSFWSWQQLDEAEAAARSRRNAQLAKEVGASPPPLKSSPAILGNVRRASYALRGNSASSEGRGGCIIS